MAATVVWPLKPLTLWHHHRQTLTDRLTVQIHDTEHLSRRLLTVFDLADPLPPDYRLTTAIKPYKNLSKTNSTAPANLKILTPIFCPIPQTQTLTLKWFETPKQNSSPRPTSDPSTQSRRTSHTRQKSNPEPKIAKTRRHRPKNRSQSFAQTLFRTTATYTLTHTPETETLSLSLAKTETQNNHKQNSKQQKNKCFFFLFSRN